MNDCFHIFLFRRVDQKRQKKRKTDALCDICYKFYLRRNKVTHCSTSGGQPNYSTSFVAIRFDFVFKESLLVTSSSYLFKQDANLSLAVLPYVDSIG